LSEPTSSPAAEPDYRAARRWNIVWVVPILALLLGGWMVYRNLSSQGPVARVRFDTADGIAAGKTEVRCRSVRVGVVKNVKLADDLKSVLIYLELGPDSGGLLRRGTRFWVVRPRVSTTDISGLGTLLTGAYIELDPGPPDAEPWKLFKGRETPPATSRSIPGRRLVLTAEEAGSLVAGSPIYFRGFEVGRIESRKLDQGGARVVYDAFIRQEYGSLVKENTRFWNTSGIDISAGADGFKVRTPSFQAMVSGGTTFGVPDGVPAGPQAADGMIFTLFSDEDAAKDAGFNPTMKFLLLFNQSVRGLSRSAPVEFRGITIGRVADISLDYLKDAADSRVPVLIEIDPSLLGNESQVQMLDPQAEFLSLAVKRGLRAALKTGSILTGALFVDFDYYTDAVPAEMAKAGGLDTFPTVSSGFAQLEAKVTAILDKLQALPLDDTMRKIGNVADEAATTVADARAALKEIEATAASARKTLDDPEFQELPNDLRATLAQLEKSVTSVGPEGAIQGDLLRTLDELRAVLRAMKAMTTTIEEKPNSLIFGKDSSGNPIPRAPSGKR
jgi:paraquat-inducible protein B